MSDVDRALNGGERLVQVGLLLFLLALLLGLAVPRLMVPRLALSAHLLGITQGTFLIAIGALWPRFRFTPGQSSLAQMLAIYGCVAAWAANVYGAAWGAGGRMLPIATGGVHGTDVQELGMKIVLRSAAVCLIVFTLLLLWRSTLFHSAKPNSPE